MSTELQTILQNNPAVIQTGLDEDTLAVAGGASSGSKRISIRGKVFRKIVGGKEVAVVEDNYMDVIIVKMAHNASRTFYAQSYKEGETVSPTCWSGDSRVPDPEIPEPQSSACDSCKFSVKGSGMGGTGSACRLNWRLAVVLPNDPGGDVMQLVLPATSAFGKEDNSRWPFRPYVQMLANNNVSAGRVVTRMQFDAKSSTPKLLFKPIAAVDAGIMETLQHQAKSQPAEQAVKLTVYQQDTSETKKVEVKTAEPVQVAEPSLQDPKAEAEEANDVTDILNKWSTKD